MPTIVDDSIALPFAKKMDILQALLSKSTTIKTVKDLKAIQYDDEGFIEIGNSEVKADSREPKKAKTPWKLSASYCSKNGRDKEPIYYAVKISLFDEIMAKDDTSLMEYTCHFQITFYPSKQPGDRAPACQIKLTAKKDENPHAYEIMEEMEKNFEKMNDALVTSDREGAPKFTGQGEEVAEVMLTKLKADKTKIRPEVKSVFTKKMDGGQQVLHISLWAELAPKPEKVRHGKEEYTAFSLKNFYHARSFDARTISDNTGEFEFSWDNSLSHDPTSDTNPVRRTLSGRGIPVFQYQGVMARPIGEDEEFDEKWKGTGYIEHSIKLNKFFVTSLNSGAIKLETVKSFKNLPKGEARGKKAFKSWF